MDRGADRALYRQIADELRGQILDGQLKPGDRLPSEAALCTRWGVFRSTVRDAIKVLAGEGLVRAEHGRGVFVADTTFDTVAYWRGLTARLAARLERHVCPYHRNGPVAGCVDCQRRELDLALLEEYHKTSRRPRPASP